MAPISAKAQLSLEVEGMMKNCQVMFSENKTKPHIIIPGYGISSACISLSS